MYVKEMPLTFEQINERIAYDPLTGEFTWKVSPSRKIKAGDELAGSNKSARRNTKSGVVSGYKYVNVLHHQTPAARVQGRKGWL